MRLIERVTIIGTGLIGTSVGLALRSSAARTAGDASRFSGKIIGCDADAVQADAALQMGAVDEIVRGQEKTLAAAASSDVVVLAVPVFAILDWMPKLAVGDEAGAVGDRYRQHQAGDHEGSSEAIFWRRRGFFTWASDGGQGVRRRCAGEAALFQGAMWLFTSSAKTQTPVEAEWRALVEKFGSKTMELDAERHDVLCAWVSHLPQMVSTAMSALLEDEFGDAADMRAIGGRALREMTRLGASPYSMWRDVALSNTRPIADTLLALEQRLAHLRENLKTPELREEFAKANRFRKG